MLNMPSTLETLPNDILLSIADLLSSKDLRNLCTVSSRIARPAQRILYGSIAVRLTTRYKPEINIRKFAALMEILSTNPSIQQYVSEVIIEVYQAPSDPCFNNLHGRILSLVPNLKSLTLNPPPLNFDLSRLPLPLLHTLNLEYTYGHRPEEPMEVLARQFWTPSLRKVSLDAASFKPQFSPLFPADRYRTSPITELDIIADSEQTIGCLPKILLCVKALERFSLDVYNPWERDHGPARMSPGSIAQCILPHAASLAQLEITGSDAAEFGETPLFGTLSNYTRLKRLAIPEPFLVLPHDEISTLVDVLPPSLEEIQLQYPMLRTQGQDQHRARRIKRLELLAMVKRDRFPALKRVVWWTQPAECWDDNVGLRYGPASDMEHLATHFDKVGVKFEWLCYAYSEGTPFKPYTGDNEDDNYVCNADVYSLTNKMKVTGV